MSWYTRSVWEALLNIKVNSGSYFSWGEKKWHEGRWEYWEKRLEHSENHFDFTDQRTDKHLYMLRYPVSHPDA